MHIQERRESPEMGEAPTPPKPRSRLPRSLLVVAVVLVPVIYALVVNATALDNPPAWDSATSVSPAALTIVETDFDIWGVAQLPSSLEGGPSIHATSIYTIGLASLLALLGPAVAFQVAHVASILLVGGLSGATYVLARERASARVSALAAIVVGTMPIVVQQAADIYLDLPLAVVTSLAAWAAVRRRFLFTALLVLVGVALKTSGVFLLPLILVARPVGRSLPRHLGQSALAALVAVLPFLPPFLTTDRFAMGTTWSGNLFLLRDSMSLLILTTDVLLILTVFTLVTYGRARARSFDRGGSTALVLVASFVTVHAVTIILSGTIAILPRYYIVLLPAVIAAMLPLEAPGDPGTTRARSAAVTALVLLGVFSLINVRGAFYPLPDHEFYVAAERSTRAQDLLDLHVLGTRELVESGLPIIADGNVHFRLSYPDMGYVDNPPEDFISVIGSIPEELPDRFVMLVERRFRNRLLKIEQSALDQGYDLSYREIEVGPYRSQLILASR